MNQQINNAGNGNKSGLLGRVYNQLAAEKEKTVITLCLLLIMGFMWFRVLSKKDDTTQSASASNENAVSADSGSAEVAFVELGFVKGRHDKLNRDFFDPGGWRNFSNREGVMVSETIEEVDRESAVRNAAGQLQIDAIIQADRPIVFVNNELYYQGSSVTVRYRGEDYEFVLVKVGGSEVVLECEGIEVVIELKI